VPDSDPSTTTDPLDDDDDDDGLIDGYEDADDDGETDDGETDAGNPDTDGDCLQDGTELGLTEPQGEDTDLSIFVPDADPSTTTNPLNTDTDGGGRPDGGLTPTIRPMTGSRDRGVADAGPVTARAEASHSRRCWRHWPWRSA